MNDNENQGLHHGAKVAIVGGGVSGAAMAAALLFTARTRGKNLQVHVFEGREEETISAPVILSAECRSRLAALGCKVTPAWRGVELSSIDVCKGSLVERLPCPPGGLWVVDGWPLRGSGKRTLSTALSAVAALQGATFHPRAAERIEHDETVEGGTKGAPPFVLRACGKADRFHAVVNACGPKGTMGDSFFEGFKPAPTLQAAHARLSFGELMPLAPSLRVVLQPVPGVDALYLVPCRDSVYALAFGPTASPADLCQSLMACARDGHLPDGFEIAALAPTAVAAGVSSSFVSEGRLAVGPAAFGHPFQLTISAALASCSRAAVALMEAGTNETALEQRYVWEGISDLLADTKLCVKANSWLRRAGDDAVRVFSRGVTEDRMIAPWSTGLFGLNAPTAKGTLRRARRAAFKSFALSLFKSQLPSLPPPRLEVGRPLFYIVDDDAAVRTALSEYLESRGAEVVCFSDELALYCAVARRPPTAVVLDVVLQWVDGLSLCDGLKRHPLTRHARVIVMSGIDRPFIRDRAIIHGAEAFMPKPVDPELLWRKLTGLPPPQVLPDVETAEPFVESGRYAS